MQKQHKVTKPRERHSWVLPQRNSPKTCCSWGCQGSSSMFHLFPFSFWSWPEWSKASCFNKKNILHFYFPTFFHGPKRRIIHPGILSVAKSSLGDLSCLHSTLQQVIQLGRASGDLHLRWLRWSVYLVAFSHETNVYIQMGWLTHDTS